MVFKVYRAAAWSAVLTIGLFAAEPAWATQGHGGIEGVYVHQIAHLFFTVAMGILIFWLRQHGLVIERGWRYIQYAALFLILWNMDAFTVHLLDDQWRLVEVSRIGSWQLKIQTVTQDRSLSLLYYLTKLDHLLCVPAIIFLYLGLKRLQQDDTRHTDSQEAPS